MHEWDHPLWGKKGGLKPKKMQWDTPLVAPKKGPKKGPKKIFS